MKDFGQIVDKYFQGKQMNILRSEASRLGYHGLPLETFIKKAGGEMILSLAAKTDDLDKKGLYAFQEYKVLKNAKIKVKKKIASLNVKWHDLGSIFAMIFSLTGLSFLWQNLIWGDLVYQQWIVFGFVIACATIGGLINEYAKGVSNEDKHTLIMTLKILAVALTFVFSLESLEYAALARPFILSCLAGVVVHGFNILFMPITKGLVKMVRFCYLSFKKYFIMKKMRRCKKELDQLNYELKIIKDDNEIIVNTTICQLELDYMLGKSASIPEGMNAEEMINDNSTTEVAHA